MKKQSFSSWFKSGAPWIWLNASSVSICLVMVVGLLGLIAVRGLSHFWPANVMEASYTESNQKIETLMGEIIEIETVTASQLKRVGVDLPGDQKSAKRVLIKVGNRDHFGIDFRWVNARWLGSVNYPEDLLSIERREWGRFYGRLVSLKQQGDIVNADDIYAEMQQRLKRSNALIDKIKYLEHSAIGKINYGIESLRLAKRQLELDGVAKSSSQYTNLIKQRRIFDDEYSQLQKQLSVLYVDLNRDQMMVKMANGQDVEIPLAKVVLVHRPNAMTIIEKLGFYVQAVWDFVSSDPREANTEGGVFPAIFGTIMMVMIMAILVTPFGVVAAVYFERIC